MYGGRQSFAYPDKPSKHQLRYNSSWYLTYTHINFQLIQSNVLQFAMPMRINMHGSFQGFSISLLIIAWYVVAEVFLSRIVVYCHMKLPIVYIYQNNYSTIKTKTDHYSYLNKVLVFLEKPYYEYDKEAAKMKR